MTTIVDYRPPKYRYLPLGVLPPRLLEDGPPEVDIAPLLSPRRIELRTVDHQTKLLRSQAEAMRAVEDGIASAIQAYAIARSLEYFFTPPPED